MKNLILLFLVVQFVALSCNSGSSTSTENGNTTGGIVDLDAAAFKAKMSEPNTIVLDVRTPTEIAAGKIPGAFDLDIQNPEFKSEVNRLDKSKTYLVYCKKGGRSSRACSILEDAGFEKIYNLEGGYDGWKEVE